MGRAILCLWSQTPGQNLFGETKSITSARIFKWAGDQEAVTLPWLPAHSILNWIGGDISMLDPIAWMSSPYSIQISWLILTAPVWIAGSFPAFASRRASACKPK
jgi:hypothetical protein